MRDNDSGGFEPEPPKSSPYQNRLLAEQFQREPPPSPPPAYATLNRSADSVKKKIINYLELKNLFKERQMLIL
jgi:hypothetical protein